jgi:uncharacterized protein involved in exopolysaccharide biosynthesis
VPLSDGTERVPATLYDYWQDIYQRKALLLTVAISAAVFAYIVSFLLPPLYEAKVTFYSPTNITVPTYTRSENAGHLTQAPFLPTADEKAAAVDIGILLSQDVYRELHTRFPSRDVDALKKNVDVNVSKEFMVDIHVRDRDPQMASDIANVLPDFYRNFHVRALRGRLQGVVDNLTRQLGQQDAEIVPALREEMTRNLMEAKLQLADPPVAVVIVQTAVPPTRPVFPLPILNTVVAGLTGIAAGAYYALLMGYLSRLKKARIQREMDWSPFLDGAFIEYARTQAAPPVRRASE